MIRDGQESDVILTRKTRLQTGWRPFFLFLSFCFGDHLNLERITVSISAAFFFLEITWIWRKQTSQFQWRPFFIFFLRSPTFGEKTRLNLTGDQSKCGSRLFDIVSSLQNSPPMQIPGDVLKYAEACNDYARPIFALLRPGNIASFEEM